MVPTTGARTGAAVRRAAALLGKGRGAPEQRIDTLHVVPQRLVEGVDVSGQLHLGATITQRLQKSQGAKQPSLLLAYATYHLDGNKNGRLHEPIALQRSCQLLAGDDKRADGLGIDGAGPARRGAVVRRSCAA